MKQSKHRFLGFPKWIEFDRPIHARSLCFNRRTGRAIIGVTNETLD